MSELNLSDQRAALSAKIKPIRIAMVTVTDDDGHLVSYPMTNQDIDEHGDLWFFTSDQTPLWENITSSPHVNASFVKGEDGVYVSVSGHARQVRDRIRIRQLWNPMAAAWFPLGLEDPHLALIQVVTRSAEFWDAKSNRMVQLYQMAKATLTGNPPPIKSGEHGKLRL
jgi:general stress protein 26